MVGPSTLHVADSKEKALVVQSWDQLLSEEGQQDGADRSEVEVVDHKGSIELECWAVAHQLAAAENYNVVCENQRRGLLHGRHWGDMGLEIEVLRVVSLDGREGLVKDGPEVDAKGAVDGWALDGPEELVDG